MKKLFVAALAVLALVDPTHAQQPTSPTPFAHLDMFALSYGGAQRSVGLYVPQTYQRGRPAPLIIALHGRFSSAQAMHAMSHLVAVAERRGAIVVYPETAGGFWNDGGYAALARREAPSDDAGFVSAVTTALAQDYAIDRSQTFLVGYDLGGAMAYNLACGGSQRFAGVAIVSALMWDYAEQSCAHASASPMLIMHGERDALYPSAGAGPTGPITARRLSAAATVDVWRRINGCNRPSASSNGDQFYANCSGAPLAYISVSGGEHDWFHDDPRYRLNHQGVNAASVIDSFFFDRAAFTLPSGGSDGGRARSWIVYVPPNYNPAHPTPVVFVLHGRPSNATAMAWSAQMNPVAARHGFIVVYPEGLNNEWNAYYDLVRQPSIAPQDDIAFLEALTQDLGVDFNIDRRRMYVSGFSNGAFMTLRMACSASNYFAAFAPVSAELYTQLTSRCQGNPAPIVLMHGTADISVPYNGVQTQQSAGARTPGGGGGVSPGGGMGGSMNGGAGNGLGGGIGGAGGLGMDGGPTRITLTAFETATYFMRRNHCSQSGATTVFPQSGHSSGLSHVTRFAAHDCQNGDDVVFYVIDGGGHAWPGERDDLPAGAGAVNRDINASEEIWNFFAAHPLPHDPQ
ncbi:MAG: hypothetical protein HY054_03595 [Proteobacteria bacterium]|nr:hypothetical protein [Pseudomonadota bacterium]